MKPTYLFIHIQHTKYFNNNGYFIGKNLLNSTVEFSLPVITYFHI